ncbi:uncharacterized protein LOC5500415 [Nematostella vectensis]|uniref:uncharacterized protein LOC5500415 n=1 Tax=Nematostella vectensis TaxID=45351 RepID=UPI002076DA2F|nr:uncharacterized protein LOC5500415 [Nematostella vectensis]
MAVLLFLPDQKNAGFLTLPDEICGLIFSYLHPIDDSLLRLAVVCRRWRDIIYNTPILWKNLSTTSANNLVLSASTKPLFDKQEHENYERKMAFKVADILQRFGRFVFRLNAKNISEQNLKRVSIFSYLRDLKSLRVIRLNLPCEKRLLSALGDSNKLEEFTARGVRLRPREKQLCRIPEEILLELGDTFPSLKKLTLCDFYISFDTVSEALAKLPLLNELRVKYRLEGGCYGGMDSSYIRNYRRCDAGLFLLLLSRSEYANRVVGISLEDVHISGTFLKELMDNFKSLKKFKLETFIDDLQPPIDDVNIESDSLQEIVIWDISNIRTINMVIPNARKLFISDLHLDSLKIYAPNLDNLRLGPLRSFDENLESFYLETGNLTSLEVTELGQLTSFALETFESILYKNPKLENLVIEAFARRLCLNQESCPCLNMLCITGAVDDVEASGNHLRRLEISGDCLNPDSIALREVSLTARDCELVDICHMPNLSTVNLRCDTINLMFLSDCIDELIQTRCATCIILKRTNIRTLDIDNVALGRIESKGESKIDKLKIRNCSIESLPQIEPSVESLELTKCNELKHFIYASETLEELSLSWCEDLVSITLNCPVLRKLKIGDNQSLHCQGEDREEMEREIRANCPRVDIVYQIEDTN